MWGSLDPIWNDYLGHRNLGQLREDLATCPWYVSPDQAEDSLLMRAVKHGDAEAAELLIALGESPTLQAPTGFTLLHQAVDLADTLSPGPERDAALKVLSVLLERGADPNVLGADGTPLHRAAGCGPVAAAQILIDHGADIEARMLTDGELTPLMHAALMDQPLMVRFLLDTGADRFAISRPALTDPPMTLHGLLAKYPRTNTNEILNLLNR